MEDMEYWKSMSQPPAYMLRNIKAGRLKGKTDINPQWRYQTLTEHFGMCGTGWKYTIDKLWSNDGSEGQVIAFAEISLYVKSNGEWSDPIPGIGGSMLIKKESSGLYTNDEGYKMAVTDALSVACKMLGVASDIYAGLWDGAKYLDSNNGKKADNGDEKAIITEDQLKNIRDKIGKQESFNSNEKKKCFDFMKGKADKISANGKLIITKKGADWIMENFDSLLNKFMGK